MLLKTNFSKVFPNGSVSIGGNHWLKFTSAAAIQAFLPQGGTPVCLTADKINPTNKITVFAGQVLALQLNVAFSDAGVTTVGLGNLKITRGALIGRTVNQVLYLANQVLGGNISLLPKGMSISNLNDIITKMNENFDGGTIDLGYLK